MAERVAEEFRHLLRSNGHRIKPEVKMPPGDSGCG
jgi:hypothetical protein